MLYTDVSDLCSFTLQKEDGLKMFKNRYWGRYFGL